MVHEGEGGTWPPEQSVVPTNCHPEEGFSPTKDLRFVVMVVWELEEMPEILRFAQDDNSGAGASTFIGRMNEVSFTRQPASISK